MTRTHPGHLTAGRHMHIDLKWWFTFCASVVGLLIAHGLGWLTLMWQGDPTRLSVVTIGLFLIMSLFIGYLSLYSKQDPARVKAELGRCWFSTELMLGFGMLGTLIGFFMMLHSAFGGFTGGDAASIKKLVTDVALGMSTAVVTTIVGLACSMLTKLQIVNLEHAVGADEE